jgi:hypothetical protein
MSSSSRTVISASRASGGLEGGRHGGSSGSRAERTVTASLLSGWNRSQIGRVDVLCIAGGIRTWGEYSPAIGCHICMGLLGPDRPAGTGAPVVHALRFSLLGGPARSGHETRQRRIGAHRGTGRSTATCSLAKATRRSTDGRPSSKGCAPTASQARPAATTMLMGTSPITSLSMISCLWNRDLSRCQ